MASVRMNELDDMQIGQVEAIQALSDVCEEGLIRVTNPDTPPVIGRITYLWVFWNNPYPVLRLLLVRWNR
jgi:hypothetical protein